MDITVVPILVGAINQDKEADFGRLLMPYLSRDDTFCVVSSDFCHWYAYQCSANPWLLKWFVGERDFLTHITTLSPFLRPLRLLYHRPRYPLR